MNKICFVVMGFGTKTDPATGTSIDLDKTYQNVIKPAVVECGFECVRADEVKDSALIDRSMYALLIRADVVIADISTMNPNALYELGVRHAVKPQSTIIIKAESTTIPFDINHTRVFSYKHLGDDIGVDEAKRMQSLLKEKMEFIKSNSIVDSPVYEYLHTLEQPHMDEGEYLEIVGALAEKNQSVFALTETAKKHMENKEFGDAIKYWKKAVEKCPNESYYIQQLALCTYKQEANDEYKEIYLNDALQLLNNLKETNDPETYGLRGAIYKRLSKLNSKNIAYIDRAIECYEKGYMINFNPYTGENLAFCYNFKESIVENEEERVFCRVSAKKIREKIYENLSQILELDDYKKIPNVKWMLATFASCCYALGEKEKGDKYENAFMEMSIAWEQDTYMQQKRELETLLNNNKKKS